MTIAEVSKAYDITADTLRYYERVGLIPAVPRTAGGIRNYETARMYVDMGVDRLGIGFTSCKPIVEGGASTENY